MAYAAPVHRRPRPTRLAAVLGALVVLATGGLVAPAAAAGPADRAAPSSVRETHQVVVRWAAADLPDTRPGRLAALGNPKRVAGLSRAAGMRAAFVRPFGTAGTAAVYRFEEPLGANANATLARLNASPGVVLAEADPIATIDAVPNDTYASQLWGQLGAADGSPYGVNSVGAWATATGAGTVVAVLDTGIRTHTDLAGQTVAGYDFIADAWSGNDGDGRDADPSDPGDFVSADQVAGHCSERHSSWHGTHVSGIVAAIANNAIGVFGTAPGTKVQPLRVLGRCGGSYTDIADAVTWASGGAVLGIPANATPADVVNLSLGSNSSLSRLPPGRAHRRALAGHGRRRRGGKRRRQCRGARTRGLPGRARRRRDRHRRQAGHVRRDELLELRRHRRHRRAGRGDHQHLERRHDGPWRRVVRQRQRDIAGCSTRRGDRRDAPRAPA